VDCILCGKCKKSCPIYKIFREELFSPRGKMALLDQKIDKNLVDFKCLFCGNCISSCPFDIDVPVSFLFENVIEEKSSKSGKKFLIDTVNCDETNIKKANQLSSVEFDDIMSIDDGVEKLYFNNNYEEIEKFKKFLENNMSNDLYFIDRSSLYLAKRIGHNRSYSFIDTLNLDYMKLSDDLTRYYKFLSEEQLNLLDLNLPKINKKALTDIKFNFGLKNLIFYMDNL